jgi:hypothetical protein
MAGTCLKRPARNPNYDEPRALKLETTKPPRTLRERCRRAMVEGTPRMGVWGVWGHNIIRPLLLPHNTLGSQFEHRPMDLL